MPDISIGTLDPPPRRGLGTDAGRGGLPRPLTSFIGRERELEQARRLLEDSYLVTLTGPGGSGKTRLCIALAAAAAGEYPDGVFFVSLAPVRDPHLVASTIAQTLGLQDARDRPLMEHLVSQLRGRRLLIVLDNFEHLLAGAAVVTHLLQETDAVRFLVSSRSSLRVSGEQECPVPPLDVPDPQDRPTAASTAACESMRLFAERAAAAVPGFAIDDQNAPAIARIVRRLDGLPLAIELAAARVKLLPPEAILPRLEDSLGLLTGGGRDLPDRLRTLRATITWSYDLLSEGARTLAFFFSPRTAATFVRVAAAAGVGACCRDVAALALSPAVAQALEALSWRSLRIAATPNAADMLAALDALLAESRAGSSVGGA